jgi:hypothetical protein
MFSVLLGSGFQWQTFPFLWVSELSPASATSFSLQLSTDCLSADSLLTEWLSGWRPSHTNLLLFKLPSQNSSVMAAGPCYTASARTEQKTLLPTTLLLLWMCLLWQSNDGYWASAKQWACLQTRFLATAVSAGFTILLSVDMPQYIKCSCKFFK